MLPRSFRDVFGEGEDSERWFQCRAIDTVVARRTARREARAPSTCSPVLAMPTVVDTAWIRSAIVSECRLHHAAVAITIIGR